MNCHYIWPSVTGDFGNTVLAILTGITMVISIPGNYITAIAIIKNEALRSEPAYLLICSTCLADALISTITQPLFITTILLGTRYSCILDHAFYALAWIPSVASSLGIAVITIDRYIYIVHPLHYMEYMTQKRAIMLITVIWLASLSYGFVPMFYINELVLHSSTLILMILISAIMMYTYRKVYNTINNSASPPQLSGVRKHKSRTESQVTRTALLVVLAFFGCWSPWVLVSLTMAIYDTVPYLTKFHESSIILKLHWIFLTIGYFNSALNVFIYSRKNTQLRGYVEKLLKRNVGDGRDRTMTNTTVLDHSPVDNTKRWRDLFKLFKHKKQHLSHINGVTTTPNNNENNNGISAVNDNNNVISNGTVFKNKYATEVDLERA